MPPRPVFLMPNLPLPMLPSSATLLLPLTATLNHLLAQEPSARAQLAQHAGKLAHIDAGAGHLRLAVTGDGYVEAAPADAAASVTIRFKLSDLPLMAQQPERAFAWVKIDGDAEFANAISQLSKSLRWDAEHDLERVVGPIAAVRLVAGARAGVAGLRQAHQKISENVAEFLLEERPVLVRRSAATDFASGVTRMRDDVERLAKRLARLEQKLAAPAKTTAAPPSLDTK